MSSSISKLYPRKSKNKKKEREGEQKILHLLVLLSAILSSELKVFQSSRPSANENIGIGTVTKEEKTKRR